MSAVRHGRNQNIQPFFIHKLLRHHREAEEHGGKRNLAARNQTAILCVLLLLCGAREAFLHRSLEISAKSTTLGQIVMQRNYDLDFSRDR